MSPSQARDSDGVLGGRWGRRKERQAPWGSESGTRIGARSGPPFHHAGSGDLPLVQKGGDFPHNLNAASITLHTHSGNDLLNKGLSVA